jgi:hypothetical protein
MNHVILIDPSDPFRPVQRVWWNKFKVFAPGRYGITFLMHPKLIRFYDWIEKQHQCRATLEVMLLTDTFTIRKRGYIAQTAESCDLLMEYGFILQIRE